MVDYDRIRQEKATLDEYLVRERALMLAQQDWHAGLIVQDGVILKARQYEAYLAGRPEPFDVAPGRGWRDAFRGIRAT